MSVRTSQTTLEVIRDDPSRVRVSQASLEVLRDQPSRVRVSQTSLEVLHSLTNFTGYVSLVQIPVTI